MKICIFEDDAHGGPTSISIVIEGVEVLAKCASLSQACFLLMGLVYAINLSYPKKVKHTFEVFQKLFLELDVLKLSSKVQTLKSKLLMRMNEYMTC